MLIKETDKTKENLLFLFYKYLFNFKKKRSIFLILIAISASGIIALLPIGLLRSDRLLIRRGANIFANSLRVIDPKYEYLANDVLKMGDNLLGIGYRRIKSSFKKQEVFKINLNFNNLNKIRKIRNNAISEGILVRSENDKVNGYFTYDGINYPIRLRLKGDWTDHLLGEKWSFRIETKKDKAFLGMQEFSLQHPRTRNYINEFIFHQLLKYEKLPYLRYKFIPVSLNGKYLGIYALEEHFGKSLIENSGYREGPIIKLSDQDYRNEFHRIQKLGSAKSYYHASEKNADILTFNQNKTAKNNQKVSHFLLGSKLIEGLLSENIPPSDVFDIKMTARFFAISDLLGASGKNEWYGMRFYLNPVLARLLPIGYDAQAPFLLENVDLAIDKNVLNIFDDPIFLKEYITELDRISKKEYIEQFIEKITPDLNQELTNLQRSYPFARFLQNEIYKNGRYIRARLFPLKPIGVRSLSTKDNYQSLTLDFFNKTKFPIEVMNIVRNGVTYNPESNKYLPGIEKLKRAQGQQIKFKMDNNKFKGDHNIKLSDNDSFGIDNEESSSVTINYKLVGSSFESSIKVRLFPLDDSISKLNPLVIRTPNVDDFDSLFVDRKNKKVYIKDNINISRPLILPVNYELIVSPGVTIALQQDGLILAQGPLKMEGEDIAKITVKAFNGGRGIVVLNSLKQSHLNNVVFEGLKTITDISLNITGGLTFYDSAVEISNAKFIDSLSEDALNLIRSPFSIKNTDFINSSSDAIDVDFSNGRIQSSTFKDVGNDAIDISGAQVYIKNVKISSAFDKGISAGERSKVFIRNVDISNGFIGVASKDLSSVEINQLDVGKVQICLAAYRKKPEYGPGFIKIKSSSLLCNKKYVLESSSSISSPDDYFIPNTVEAYSQLYLKADNNEQ